MKPSRNTIIFAICAIVVLGGGIYYFFFFNHDSGAAVSTNGAPASDAELSFIALVSKLDPIVFDTTVLSDPRFTSLQDIRTAILPEDAGRTDPFAPLGK